MGAPKDWDRYIGSGARRPVRELAAAVYWGTRKTFPQVWIGRGWDHPVLSGRYPETGQWDDEHGTGRALDIICAPEVGVRSVGAYRDAGEAIVSWIIANAKQMHVRHIIWQNAIWKTRFGAWFTLSGNRVGVSNRHEDHIHVFFEDSSGDIPQMNSASVIKEELEMNAETRGEVAQIVAHEIWDTDISGMGRFYDAFRNVVLKVQDLSRDLADVRRADGTYAVNQEIADTKSTVLALDAKVDELSASVGAVLKRLGE